MLPDVLPVSPRFAVYDFVPEQSIYAVPFAFDETGTVRVQRIRSGVLAVDLTPGTDFTVSPDSGLAGTLTLTAAGLAQFLDGDQVVPYGMTELTRPGQFSDTKKFAADLINWEQNSQLMLDQEARRDVARSLKLPLGETAGPIVDAATRAGYVSGFDDAGTFGKTSLLITTLENLTALTDAQHDNIAAAVAAIAAGALNPILQLTNTWDLKQTLSGNALITNNGPRLEFAEADGAADNKKWWVSTGGENFYIQTRSDDELTAANAISITRTGITVDMVAVNATLFQVSTNLTVGGTAGFTGEATFSDHVTFNSTANFTVGPTLNGSLRSLQGYLGTPLRVTHGNIAPIDYTLVPYVYMITAGRVGWFGWVAGDYSAQVALDTYNGLYYTSTLVPASTGVWKRMDFETRPLCPEHFGTTGDGIVNDGARLVSMLSLGYDVHWTKGKTYKIDGYILTPASNTTWTGRGKIYKTTSVGTEYFVLIDGKTNVTLNRCYLRGSSGSREIIAYIVNSSDIMVINSIFNDQADAGAESGGSSPIRVGKDTNNIIVDGNILRHGLYNIATGGIIGDDDLDGPVRNLRITNNYFYGADTEAIDINHHTQNFIITHNTFERCGKRGDAGNEAIDIGSTTIGYGEANICADGIVAHNTIVVADTSGNAGTTDAVNGIQVKGYSERIHVFNNVVTGQGSTSSANYGVRMSHSRDCTVENNTLNNFSFGCVMVSSGYGNTFNGNKALDCHTGGIWVSDAGTYEDITIDGNKVYQRAGGAGSGIVVYELGAGCSVTNNYATGFAAYGLKVNPDVVGCDFDGNIVRDCGTNIQFEGSNCSGRNMQTSYSDNYGILVGGPNNDISGTKAFNNNQGGGAHYGILANSSADGITMVGCQSYDTQVSKTQRGVNFSGAIDRGLVTGCRFYPNSTTNVSGSANITAPAAKTAGVYANNIAA